MTKTLIIIRGVQGSGKSTLAQTIVDHAVQFKDPGEVPYHYEADMYFSLDGTYKWDPARIGQAHRWCEYQANEAMKAGRKVIVSNTFVKKEEMKPYLEMADQHGYQVQEIICKGRFKNVHGVPEEKVEAKRKQFQYE